MKMLNGATGSARISDCGQYRTVLIRKWDERPRLLVCMFNPSRADWREDDPTIHLVCQIAAHNGFGGITVVNGIPLRSPTPADAADMVNTWDKRQAWDERDRLFQNVDEIKGQVEQAGAVLLAWGALADLCPEWFDHIIEQIREALPEGVPLKCLGKTKGGHPKHPLARGIHKVRADAPLLDWEAL